MTIKRGLIGALAAVILVAASPASARQGIGALAGKATDEAKQPYSDYAVQLRDANSGLVVSTKTLDVQGQFSFLNLAIARTYLVELVQIKDKKIVCTEGPYNLTASAARKLDVNISCGKVPAAIWLLAAGAGAAAAVAVATRSTSR
jgi:hypothetical protein